jgi:hypothetical protein
MVEEPSAFRLSSYSINAYCIKSDLQTPHPEYLARGKTKDERLNNYRELFKAHIETELLAEIRENINKGLALGNERFTTQIENLTKRRVTTRKAGRPKKDNQVTDNAQDNQLHTLTPIIPNYLFGWTFEGSSRTRLQICKVSSQTTWDFFLPVSMV